MKKDRFHLPPYDVVPVSMTKELKERYNWAFEKFAIRKLWEKYGQGDGVKVLNLDTGPAPGDHKDIEVKEYVNFTDDEDSDKCGHGIWTGSCIKASGGFLGLAPKCELLVAKILDNKGNGKWDWMRKGLEFGLQREVQLINISAGGDPPDDERYKIEPVLKKLADLGVIIVCAAGNERGIHIFPASDYNTLAVGSVNRKDEVSGFSDFGPRMITMAPGEDLLGCWLDNGYARASGTSMSTPEITGILALVSKSHRLNLTEAIFRFAWTSKNLRAFGWDPDSGWGLVQPWKFMDVRVANKKINWAWIVNFGTFIAAYILGDEDYRVEGRSK